MQDASSLQVLRGSALALSELVLDSLPVAVYVCDGDGFITRHNRHARELWGRTPAADELFCGAHRRYSSAGVALRSDQTPIASVLRTGTPARQVELMVVRVSGDRFWVEADAEPLTDALGNLLGATCCLRDISERKRAELRQRLLVNELNHRVKNTLSTVQSLVMQSLRNAHTLGQARGAIEHRLLALARTHDVLTAEQWQGAELVDLVEGSLSVHCSEPARLMIEGPPVRLLPQPSLTFALALHELCTNAVKYGALSNDSGRVDVTWTVTEAGDQRQLRLLWRESGGPEVQAPTSRGFGSRLIEKYLGAQLQGTVRWNFERDGVVCEVVAPWTADAAG